MTSNTQELLERYADEIVTGTACTLSHIRDVNDWNDPKPSSTTFVGRDVPDLPIRNYCQRLQKYFRCSPAVYLSALIYVDRYVTNSEASINRLTIHRLLLVAFIISVKNLEDLHYSNAYYSQVGGVDLKEVNRLEMCMLKTLKYDLHITDEQFKQYFSELAMHPRFCPTCKEEDPDSHHCNKDNKKAEQLNRDETQKEVQQYDAELSRCMGVKMDLSEACKKMDYSGIIIGGAA